MSEFCIQIKSGFKSFLSSEWLFFFFFCKLAPQCCKPQRNAWTEVRGRVGLYTRFSQTFVNHCLISKVIWTHLPRFSSFTLCLKKLWHVPWWTDAYYLKPHFSCSRRTSSWSHHDWKSLGDTSCLALINPLSSVASVWHLINAWHYFGCSDCSSI